MKPVEQTIARPPKGDCFRACIASILEMPIADCPNPPSDPDGHWWNEWIDWLRPRGLELIHWQVPEGGRAEGEAVCGALAGYWIATVPSLNCPPNPERPNLGRHCIVMRGAEVAHDPSTGEKRKGFTGDDRIFEVTLLHSLDPARGPNKEQRYRDEATPERTAYSVDASQYVKVRPDGDDCIELEAVNRGRTTEVWLDPRGIEELLDALRELSGLQQPDTGRLSPGKEVPHG